MVLLGAIKELLLHVHSVFVVKDDAWVSSVVCGVSGHKDVQHPE